MDTPSLPNLESPPEPTKSPKGCSCWGMGCMSVLGIFIFLAIWIPNNVEMIQRTPAARAQSDMRSLATAIESYMVDNNNFPRCGKDNEGINFSLPNGHPAREIYTFRRHVPGICTLTTPVSYITSYPHDYLSKRREAYLGYYTVRNAGWILWSCGPDGVYDIDPERDYNPSLPCPSPQLLAKSYDVTNGVDSRGDIFRISNHE
jgi:hypothetical protein